MPSFGVKGGRPTHCKNHKTPIMLNLVSKNCEEDKLLNLDLNFSKLYKKALGN